MNPFSTEQHYPLIQLWHQNTKHEFFRYSACNERMTESTLASMYPFLPVCEGGYNGVANSNNCFRSLVMMQSSYSSKFSSTCNCCNFSKQAQKFLQDHDWSYFFNTSPAGELRCVQSLVQGVSRLLRRNQWIKSSVIFLRQKPEEDAREYCWTTPTQQTHPHEM